MNISKEQFTKLVKEHLLALESYKMDKNGNKPIEIFGIEKLYEAINVIQCCVNKDLDKHPIEGVNEFMLTDQDIEDTQFYCAGVEAGNRICESQCIGCDGFQRDYEQ